MNNTPTLDEQIEYFSMQAEMGYVMEAAALASLRELATIKSAEMPEEPEILALQSGRMVVVSENASLVEYVWHEDYKKLRTYALRVTAERDALRKDAGKMETLLMRLGYAECSICGNWIKFAMLPLCCSDAAMLRAAKDGE